MTRPALAPHREPLTVNFSARTDTGRVRASNEDNFLIDRKLRLYVVCDGLGGHASGEIASAAAVNAVREGLVRRKALLEAYEFDTGAVDEASILGLLREVVQEANAGIHDRGLHIPSQRGMGTTLSLVLVARDKVFTAHVGDSRIYRLRHGALWQISEDHSLIGELKRGLVVDAHALMQLDGRTKNQVTRALGVKDTVEVDVEVSAVKPGDRYLLCTDGLHGLVAEDDIGRLLSDNDISLVADRLVDLANAMGGTDNITVVALEVEAPPVPSAPRVIWPDFDALRAAPLFRQLADDDLAALLHSGQTVELGPSDSLLTEDSPIIVPGLFVVIAGEVAVRRRGEPVAYLRSGDTFGEESLFIERTNTVDMMAGPDGARLVLLERSHFEAMAMSEPARVVTLVLSLGRSLSRKVDASAREAGVKAIYQPATYQSRPTPRPASGQRLLVDTEPEPARHHDGTLPEPPDLPPSGGSTVLRRPRSTERRVYPAPTAPAPEGLDDDLEVHGTPLTAGLKSPRSAELPHHLVGADLIRQASGPRHGARTPAARPGAISTGRHDIPAGMTSAEPATEHARTAAEPPPLPRLRVIPPNESEP